MMRELDEVLVFLGRDESVHAVILAAEGPAFSAGHDLNELRERSEDAYREIFDQCVTLMTTIESIPQPVIAEVAAIATAAGCQLVADVRSSNCFDERKVRDAGRSHRTFLQHADGGAEPRHRPQARDGNATDRRLRSTRGRRSTGAW